MNHSFWSGENPRIPKVLLAFRNFSLGALQDSKSGVRFSRNYAAHLPCYQLLQDLIVPVIFLKCRPVIVQSESYRISVEIIYSERRKPSNQTVFYRFSLDFTCA